MVAPYREATMQLAHFDKKSFSLYPVVEDY